MGKCWEVNKENQDLSGGWMWCIVKMVALGDGRGVVGLGGGSWPTMGLGALIGDNPN